MLAGGQKYIPNVVVVGEWRTRPCSTVVAFHKAHLVVVLIRVHISFGNTVIFERKVPGKGST